MTDTVKIGYIEETTYGAKPSASAIQLLQTPMVAGRGKKTRLFYTGLRPYYRRTMAPDKVRVYFRDERRRHAGVIECTPEYAAKFKRGQSYTVEWHR